MENIGPGWPGIRWEEPQVNFTSYAIDFDLSHQKRTADWVIETVREEGHHLHQIDFIFCSDEYLLEINRNHLGHDDYTDIITFPLEDDPIIGEIYISIDRVKENAITFQTGFENELKRVIIHGVLHLCGYDDHAKADIKEIRQKEEMYLSKW